MRKYTFHLDPYQTELAFSPIRSKLDYVDKLMFATKLMLFPVHPPENMRGSSIILNVAKMSRLTFISQNKCFSMNFPFVAKENEDGSFVFSNHAHPSIDHRATSITLGLMNDFRSQNPSALDLAGLIEEAESVDPFAWKLFMDLLTTEDGYVRYDDDPIRENGTRHPRHHLDIFYSNHTTFKLGFRKSTEAEDFIDILNLETDCHFISR